MNREAIVANTFVELADSLVDDFDVVDLLTTLSDKCVEILDVDAAGIMLVDSDGMPRATASSSDVMRMIEVFEVQSKEGPCLDCCRTGRYVVNDDLTTDADRWPMFTPVARAGGFRATEAVPMRLRDKIIGAVNLFSTDTGSLDEDDLVLAQAFADVATIAILQQRTIFNAETVNDQLNNALNSRITIEQAKGIIAERDDLDMAAAFARLRAYARSNNRRLQDVAVDVINRRLQIA